MDLRADDWIQVVDPEAPGLGLQLPAVGGVLEGVSGMVKLLETAVPVHGSSSDTDLVFRALNDTLREGNGHGGWDTDVNPFGGGEEDLVDELAQLCTDSDLESVDFGHRDATGDTSFATRTILDMTDQLPMTIWTDAAGRNWIDVAGRVQQMAAPHLEVPAESRDEADMIAELAAQLTAIHHAAEAIFRDLDPQKPDTAFELINTVAYMAMNGGMEELDPSITPWHAWADQFGAHCRLGFWPE